MSRRSERDKSKNISWVLIVLLRIQRGWSENDTLESDLDHDAQLPKGRQLT